MNTEEAIERIARDKRAAIKKLHLFDANIWLGRPGYFPLAEELHIINLTNVLKKYSIHGALVSHWGGVTMSAQDCNQALIDVQNDLPENVYTIWTGLPLFPREQDPLPGFGKPDSHLRGVRLFPKSHNYSLTQWVVGELCEWCIAYNVPLFFWHVEIEWNPLYRLAQQYPDLHIIIESQWQKILYHNRNLYSLMKAHNNVYIETSNFVGQDFITHAVRTFGAERLIFGSFLPVNDPFTSIGMILDADISEKEKILIAGENIKRLINEVKL